MGACPPQLAHPSLVVCSGSTNVTGLVAQPEWLGHKSALLEPRSARGTQTSLLQLCIPEMKRAAQAQAVS